MSLSVRTFWIIPAKIMCLPTYYRANVYDRFYFYLRMGKVTTATYLLSTIQKDATGSPLLLALRILKQVPVKKLNMRIFPSAQPLITLR